MDFMVENDEESSSNNAGDGILQFSKVEQIQLLQRGLQILIASTYDDDLKILFPKRGTSWTFCRSLCMKIIRDILAEEACVINKIQCTEERVTPGEIFDFIRGLTGLSLHLENDSTRWWRLVLVN